jgi:hypothetical protein
MVLHTIMCANKKKTNITLKLDAELLREARILAAEEDTSISALLASRLEQIVRERKATIALASVRSPDYAKECTSDGPLPNPVMTYTGIEVREVADKFFVDTNILIYAHDSPTTPTKSSSDRSSSDVPQILPAILAENSVALR